MCLEFEESLNRLSTNNAFFLNELLMFFCKNKHHYTLRRGSNSYVSIWQRKF